MELEEAPEDEEESRLLFKLTYLKEAGIEGKEEAQKLQGNTQTEFPYK